MEPDLSSRTTLACTTYVRTTLRKTCGLLNINPAGICLLKVNNKNTRQSVKYVQS